MHGYGVHTFINGTEYEGTYDVGKWHGKGMLIKRDGTRYEGGFRKGKFQGNVNVFEIHQRFLRRSNVRVTFDNKLFSKSINDFSVGVMSRT